MTDRLVWIDCEMTGLDLVHDALVEVAAIVTDADLNVLDEGIDVLIAPPQAALDQMDEFVVQMHTASGLLEALAGPETVSLEEAERQVLAYVAGHVPEPRKAPLCGSSVYTDRGFLARDMPALEAHLHYRLVDVSSFKELARRWYPRVYFNAPAKQGGHRALADIRDSIEELRYYRAALFVPPPARTPRPRARSPRSTACRPRPRADRPHRVARQRLPGTRRPPVHSAPAFGLPALGPRGGCSSAGRAPGCGPGGRGFKSRHSPHVPRVEGRRRSAGAHGRPGPTGSPGPAGPSHHHAGPDGTVLPHRRR